MRCSICILLLFAILTSSFLFSCADDNPGGVEGSTFAPETSENGGQEIPAGKVFYVSAEGSDENEGNEAHPLLTLEGARRAVSEYRKSSGLPEGGIEVIFEPGTYRVDSQTVFTADDSGDADRPVVYRAKEKGSVIFDGGVRIDPSLFVPASDEVKAKLTDESARSNLMEADLNAAGCYDLDDSTEYDIGWECRSYRQELYVDNERQTVARWPNADYEAATILCQNGETPYVTIPVEKAELWENEPDIRYFGYPVYDWDAVNLGSGAVRIDKERSVYEILKTGHYAINGVGSSRYYLYNLLCELDTPGEYYWDVENGKLYYYPDGELEGKKISFSQFADDFIKLDGASYVSFCGFAFENSRSAVFDGVTGDEGHILIEDCVFRDLGGYAVYLEGFSVSIRDCEMFNLGSGCIKLIGGNLEGVLASGSTVENCLMHDWSQTYTVYNPAIRLDGYGHTVSHNEFYNSPHGAIIFDCGGSVIEYNYIHDVCTETGDAGAVYSGRRWDRSANLIRYNLIVGAWSSGTQQPCAIYLDDCLAGQIVYGNITVNADSLWIGGGKKNRIYNNIFIMAENTSAVTYDERGVGNGFMHETVTYPEGYMWVKITSYFSYLSDMQRFAVPENLLMIEQTGFSFESRPDDPGTPSYATVRDNLIYTERGGWEGSFMASAAARLGWMMSNVVYDTDPGFVDPENGNYSLRDDSRVFRDIPGFENIDYASIGRTK